MSKSRHSRWRYVRVMAWNRDRKKDAPCWICGDKINYMIPPSSAPNAWEADHIKPVYLYPELELDLNNIAPSHRKCNRARGKSRTRRDDIGMRTRIW